MKRKYKIIEKSDLNGESYFLVKRKGLLFWRYLQDHYYAGIDRCWRTKIFLKYKEAYTAIVEDILQRNKDTVYIKSKKSFTYIPKENILMNEVSGEAEKVTKVM